tara:strand:- start:244 stop:756 length:513 start_codon:yes stop_codon:yes gene_type:complete
MFFFSIDAYSSIWFWSLLIIAWSISIDKFSVHSHDQWHSASKSGASQQKEILRSFYLKADYQSKYKNNILTLLSICFSSFFIVNLAVVAFFYSVEFLQAAFLLFCPFLTCIILRLSLRQSIGSLDEVSFKDVFKKVKLFRRVGVVIASVSLLSSITWGFYLNLKTILFLT